MPKQTSFRRVLSTNTLRTVLKRVFFAVTRCVVITPVKSLVRLRSRLRTAASTVMQQGSSSLHLTPVIFYTRTRVRMFAGASATRTRRVVRSFQAVAALALLAITIFAAVAGTVAPANAAATDVINFQARLETPSGTMVNDGFYNIEFKL